ncbi:hypothetical protein Pfo_019229 [Paulownia fortunei]|nr:hypothetical protein Pfo_019229 [Paulownia fortunei]
MQDTYSPAMSKNSCPCLLFSLDPGQTHPWLLVSQGKNLQTHTFYSISKNEYLERNIPEFRNKKVLSTSYGWLALIDIGKLPLDCCLVNIESKEKIQLPHIELEGPESSSWYYKCILSKPPSDPDCHVLFSSSCDNSLLFCRLGDEKFMKRTIHFGDDYLRSATNFNGKIYAWMSRSCRFVEVDFVGQELILKQLVNDRGQLCQIPWPSPSVSCRFADYLVESCNELLLVHMICYNHSGEVAYFRIFKVNTSERECLELRSIGDRTIFLGPFGSMSSSYTDKPGVNKNSIYYTWTDKNLYVYDIEDRSKTLIKLCPVKRGALSLKFWVVM